jgi:ribose 5-phosphate isomerase B
MRVAVGSDHAGFELKEILKAELAALGHDVADLGTYDATTSVDYPDFGAAVGRAVAGRRADLGICVCGSGNGIAMAANKVPGVRAAVVHDVTTASLAGSHNHANVVCFGARTTGTAVVIDALGAFLDALAAFLDAPGEHSRHRGRIQKLAALDGLHYQSQDRELVHLNAPEGTP